MYKVIEKKNPLAVHALCETLESAEYWLYVRVPRYIELGYFQDKTLTHTDFQIWKTED